MKNLLKGNILLGFDRKLSLSFYFGTVVLTHESGYYFQVFRPTEVINHKCRLNYKLNVSLKL